MAIVYAHIRKDTDQIFYIGIGKKKERAHSQAGRNKHWKWIVNKVGYKVDIFKEDGSQKKFKELFKLNNLNDSYYLLLTNGSDERGFTLEQFEKLHNYIISALHTMLSFEEYLPEIIKNR